MSTYKSNSNRGRVLGLPLVIVIAIVLASSSPAVAQHDPRVTPIAATGGNSSWFLEALLFPAVLLARPWCRSGDVHGVCPRTRPVIMQTTALHNVTNQRTSY